MLPGGYGVTGASTYAEIGDGFTGLDRQRFRADVLA